MSNFDPQIHHRQSIRLEGYDYSQPGAYFVTMVTYRREALFGEINDGEVLLSPQGDLVRNYWMAIPRNFPQIRLDEFVLMPDHLHGIIFISTGEAFAKISIQKLLIVATDASPQQINE
jgi:REP element-mobilizing transposase RayT